MKTIAEFSTPSGAGSPARLCLVGSELASALKACKRAMEQGVIKPIFVGHSENTASLIDQLGIKGDYEIVHSRDHEESAYKAMQLARRKKVEILMKGQVDTGILLRALLNKEDGLPVNGVLSAISVFEYGGKLCFMTDAAVNIEMDLDKKAAVIKNAVQVAKRLGIAEPKVAALAPLEKVSSKIEETVHAAKLAEMSRQGVFDGAIVDGPMALDLAISKASVAQKKFKSPVAGEADILFAPNLCAANILHKSFALLTDSPHCAVVAGTSIPLIINSRSENENTKFNSIALASYLSPARNGDGQ